MKVIVGGLKKEEIPKLSKDYKKNDKLNDLLHIAKPIIPVDAITKTRREFMKKIKK